MSLIETLVEITLNDPNDFLKIKETLQRIGVASRKEQKLYQSCHILHKQGRYYLVHFKELFALDGKSTDFSDDDKGRRNTITSLLEDWGLLNVVNKNMIETPRAPINQIKIIPHKDKNQWELCAKYNIGRSKRQEKSM